MKIRASHILVTTNDKTEAEALILISKIGDLINETNFAEIARQYSEGPSERKFTPNAKKERANPRRKKGTSFLKAQNRLRITQVLK